MKKLLFLLALPALFVLSSCSSSSNSSSTAKNQPEVVTSFYPMYAFTKEIAGDNTVSVQNIMPSNQDVHEFEPSAKEVATMTDAKVLVYNDNDLEKWASAIHNKGTEIEAAKNVKMISSDPHTWLSPKEAIIEVQTIAAGLEKEFPQYKDQFAQNADKFLAQLKKLDAQYTDTLKNVKTKTIITQHDAFSYLARDYGLTAIPIAGLDPEQEPSSATLVKLKQVMKEKNLQYVYSEEDANSKIAATLAKETGAKLVGLNTLESITNKEVSDGDNYINLMQENLKTLESTLNN